MTMPPMSTRLFAAATMTVLVLTACATPPQPVTSGVALPASWNEAAALTPVVVQQETDWWRRFDSPTLEALIAAALAGNPDLAIAHERVAQAELAVRSSAASLFPGVDLTASTAARASEGGDSSTERSRSSTLGLGIRYEIDIWGSNLTRTRGSQAQLNATRHDYEAARLSLAAGVANAYTQVLAQRARIAIARDNLAVAERLAAVVAARHRHGAASALDVSRQRATVLTQRERLLPLEVQARQNLRALALLTGRVPQDFHLDDSADSFARIAIPQLDAPLPGTVLARRPDIGAAEARLIAADADIAVARAALFPLKLSLDTGTALASDRLAFASLGDPATTAGLSLSLLQAVFDGGRLQSEIASSESRRRQTLELYRKAILEALKEADDALAAVARNQTQEQLQLQIRFEAERALRLSELRYREGRDSLDELLDAQRSLFSVQDQLVQQRLARFTATLDLYKALGGGWARGG
ncbi:MAG: efflux transporter outer membrane subunit [Rhodocyclales bacterium]|nr:efflux transporter outer membrane subunit [Rhodocyclales bacterium]